MITIVEPVLGMLLSSVAKRAVGQTWQLSQSIGLLLELLVDYIVLMFLVFMATGYASNKLCIRIFDFPVELTKEAWAFIFLISIIVAALCWKQSKAQIFATVKLKASPKWGRCLLWLMPNIVLAFAATMFVFGVVAL
jgi:hypothetical protein